MLASMVRVTNVFVIKKSINRPTVVNSDRLHTFVAVVGAGEQV